GGRDGVVHRGAAGRLHVPDGTADSLRVVRPGLGQRGVGRKLHEQQLVVPAEEVEDEPVYRGAGGRHLLIGHAAARVERDAEAHRHALVAEMRDLLDLAVVVDGEVLLAEPRDEAAVVIGYRRGDVDQLDAAAKR